MNPLVTIAIPVYKAKYLKDAVESALNQTYKNIEVIIVNDNSPEDIDSIIDNFSDSRLKYYVNEVNLGKENPVNNWNKCLSYATGDFFCLLCDDDKYEPAFVEDLLFLSQKYPRVDVFRSAINIIDSAENLITIYPASPEFESTIDYIWHVITRYRKQTISEWMIRTSRIKECNGYYPLPLAWGSDYVSIYEFSSKNGIVSSPKRNISFRMSGDNISSLSKETVLKKIEAYILQHKYTLKFIMASDENNKDVLIKKSEEFISFCLIQQLALGTISTFLKVLGNMNLYRFSSRMLLSAFLLKIKINISNIL